MVDWLGNMKGLAGSLANRFSGKRNFNKISADEIRQERIRLEQVEMKILKEVEGIEKEKKELFSQGTQESSQRIQLILARKIKELDAKAKGMDKQLAMVSRQSRVLSGLTILKENESLLKEMGVSNIINSMDMTNLEKYIEQATVQGEFQMEKLGRILEVVEGADDSVIGQDEDEDTLAIMAAMQQAKTSQNGGDNVAINEGMKSAQEILDKSKSKEDEDI